jgi:hypothetical protein
MSDQRGGRPTPEVIRERTFDEHLTGVGRQAPLPDEPTNTGLADGRLEVATPMSTM